ncbi:MAG: hypothetical protein SGI84_00475 [Gemmatimonadota bacterium]|nr:hypothetical protein [Gemmatimonadota bacterium]
MEVQLAVLADGANVSQEGKLNILGEFNTIYGTEPPLLHPLMYFVAKVNISAGDGPSVVLRLRVVDAEGAPAAPELALHAAGKPPSDGTPAPLLVVIPIVQAVFRQFAEYTFELRGPSGPPLAEVALYVRPVPGA